jgi:solute carrier family 25 (mitochondrial carnitine/acylcarnitine transporter), member 20/29
MSSLLFNKDSLIDLAAGWCSGAAAVICCQPIDTILTRNQAGARLVIGSLSPRTLVADAGITKLWRGALPMIGAVPLQNALLMAGYGLGKRSETNWGVFVGGCTGGVIQSFLMSPVELLKVQLQVDLQVGAAAPAGAAHQSQRTNVTAPIRQFLGSTVSSPLLAWRGLGATLLRDGIPHGVWFVSYEVAKDYLGSLLLISNDQNGDIAKDGGYHKSLTVPLLSGAFAATAAWVRSVMRVELGLCHF